MLMCTFKGENWIIKLKKCIFIGYKDGIKGYKIWSLVTKKIVYSQDVVFREVKTIPKWEVQLREEELETK
jgi:hypothetical protein